MTSAKSNHDTIIHKIDMDNGSYPHAKDIGRVLAKTKLSGTHRGIIDLILCETFGWYDKNSPRDEKLKKRKIWGKIRYSDFEDWGRYTYPKISKALNELLRWRIIERKGKPQNYKYSFNVQVKEWDNRVFKKPFEDWGFDYETKAVLMLESDKIKQIKKYISLRDGGRCQLCENENDSLIIHHIDYNKNDWEDNNLITVCRGCLILTNFQREKWIKLFNEKIRNKLSKQAITQTVNYPNGELPITRKGNNELPEKATKTSQDSIKNAPPSAPKELSLNNSSKETSTVKPTIPDIEFFLLTPQQKFETLNLLINEHFSKFPYSKQPGKKIHGDGGWIKFKVRTREYYEGIFEKYPTLSPIKIAQAISESEQPEPWKIYPEKRAQEERYLTQEEVDNAIKQRNT